MGHDPVLDSPSPCLFRFKMVKNGEVEHENDVVASAKKNKRAKEGRRL